MPSTGRSPLMDFKNASSMPLESRVDLVSSSKIRRMVVAGDFCNVACSGTALKTVKPSLESPSRQTLP